MGGAPPFASSSRSGVNERPSESEKLFSRGIVVVVVNGDDCDDDRVQ